MTEPIEPIEPTEPTEPADDRDEAGTDAATLADLRSILRSTDGPSVDPERRAARLAAAMSAYDASAVEHTAHTGSTEAPVVHLADHRRARGRRLTAVAAAAVFVVGVGIGIRAGGGSSDQADVATARVATSEGAAIDDAGGASADQSTMDKAAATTTAPMEAAAGVEAATPDAFASSASADLGTFDTPSALAGAVLDAGLDAGGDTGTGTDVDPPTTPAEAPPSAEPGDPATECADQIASLGVPRFSAIVGGRRVIAAPSPAAADRVDVVTLDDCSITVVGR